MKYTSPSIISAYFTHIRIAVQLREHAQIPTRPARLLAAIRANSLTAQTERSVAATSAVLVTESELSSTYQHCYWMR